MTSDNFPCAHQGRLIKERPLFSDEDSLDRVTYQEYTCPGALQELGSYIERW